MKNKTGQTGADKESTKESVDLYHADQAQGADYFQPKNQATATPSDKSTDAVGADVPGSRPARNQTNKPE